MDGSPQFGLIIVGDEILSGKRADKHLGKVIELFAARGLRLEWALYLPDDRTRIADSLRRSFAQTDHVFCCGGIGATPDDHTRQAAAEALGVGLALQPEAADLIAARCQEMAAQGLGTANMSHPENLQRLRMGEFPVGARIISNPYNRIPGFAIRNHWFLPGFPAMAWPMIEAVLDAHYRACFGHGAKAERSLLLFDTPESRIAPLMEEIESRFTSVKAFSLPSLGDGNDGRPARRHIELGVKGRASDVEKAFEMLQGAVASLGAPFELQEAKKSPV